MAARALPQPRHLPVARSQALAPRRACRLPRRRRRATARAERATRRPRRARARANRSSRIQEAPVRLGLTGRMLTASAALALVVAAAFAVMLLAIGDQRHSAERARHSDEVLAAANNLEKLVLDLETGQRGFVITGQETFLDPWKSARRAFPLQARSLDGLVSDNPAQEARARAIEQAGLDYLREYSDPLVATARADQARAKSMVAS